MYIYELIFVCVCTYACMYQSVCMHTFMCMCVYMYRGIITAQWYLCTYISLQGTNTYMHICLHASACMHVCIYIHTAAFIAWLAKSRDGQTDKKQTRNTNTKKTKQSTKKLNQRNRAGN